MQAYCDDRFVLHDDYIPEESRTVSEFVSLSNECTNSHYEAIFMEHMYLNSFKGFSKSSIPKFIPNSEDFEILLDDEFVMFTSNVENKIRDYNVIDKLSGHSSGYSSQDERLNSNNNDLSEHYSTT